MHLDFLGNGLAIVQAVEKYWMLSQSGEPEYHDQNRSARRVCPKIESLRPIFLTWDSDGLYVEIFGAVEFHSYLVKKIRESL